MPKPKEKQPVQWRQWLMPLSVAQMLRRRKWQVLAGWVLGSAVTVAVVLTMKPVYTANAIIQVESQSIPESFVTATVQTALESRLDMLKQQVLVRDRLWSLIEQLNLYPKERERLTKEEVLAIMREDMPISLVRGWSTRGPGAFQVEYRAPDPGIAAEVANRVGMFFINENLRQRTEEAVSTSEFLDQQLAEAERRLREREAVLKEFKLMHNGELPQQEGALLAAMTQSRIELLGIQEALSRAQQNKLMLGSTLAAAESEARDRQAQQQRQETSTAPAPVVAAPLTELQRARLELRSLRSRYFDSHPDVKRLEREVARLAAEQEETKPERPPEAPSEAVRPTGNGRGQEAAPVQPHRERELRAQIDVVESEIRTLEDRRQRVLDEVKGNQVRIQSLPAREQQLAGITRNYETCKANYDSLLNKKLAADVAASMERRQKSQRFVMIDRARVPQKPTRPRRALLIPAGVIASLGLSIGLAGLLELRKNALLGEWELPPDIAVLGRIPRMKLGRAS